MSTLFCLVDIQKHSFLTSCVFWFDVDKHVFPTSLWLQQLHVIVRWKRKSRQGDHCGGGGRAVWWKWRTPATHWALQGAGHAEIRCSGLLFVCLFVCCLYILLSHFEFFPWEILGRFPQEKTAATESRYPTLIHYKVHAVSFPVSTVHWTLAWTTGSLTLHTGSFLWVHYIFYAGVVHTEWLTASQHYIFDMEKLSKFVLVLLTGFKPWVFGSLVWRSTNWATPSPCPVNLR